MNQSVKIKEADYKKLKEIAGKTHRTISGTISYLLEVSGHLTKSNAKAAKQPK